MTKPMFEVGKWLPVRLTRKYSIFLARQLAHAVGNVEGYTKAKQYASCVNYPTSI